MSNARNHFSVLLTVTQHKVIHCEAPLKPFGMRRALYSDIVSRF